MHLRYLVEDRVYYHPDPEDAEELIKVIKANRSLKTPSAKNNGEPSERKKPKLAASKNASRKLSSRPDGNEMLAFHRDLVYQPRCELQFAYSHAGMFRKVKHTLKSTGSVSLPVDLEYQKNEHVLLITLIDEREGYSGDMLFSLNRLVIESMFPGHDELYFGQDASLQIAAEVDIIEGAFEATQDNSNLILIDSDSVRWGRQSGRYNAFDFESFPWHFVLRTNIYILPKFFQQVYPETILNGRAAMLEATFGDANTEHTEAFFNQLSQENGKNYPNEPSPELLYASLSPAKNLDVPVDPTKLRVSAKDPSGKGKGRATDDEMLWDPTNPDFRITYSPLELIPNLLPFQSRSVGWLLKREGKRALLEDFDEEGHHILTDFQPCTDPDVERGPFWCIVSLESSPDLPLWYNPITAELALDDPLSGEYAPFNQRAGSMLCDEMGTGKTVELLAVILMHRQPERLLMPTYYDPDLQADVQPTNLTLIVAPSAIIGQWSDELARHTPTLRILNYNGIQSCKVNAEKASREYDVVLTTYDVLKKEVAFARKPVERNTRSIAKLDPALPKKARYKRSLLIELDFLRVVMDEVQMLGSAASQASETVDHINRLYSIAVSGTPIGSKIGESQSLLKFLNVEPCGSDQRCFKLLIEPICGVPFCKLFQDLGIRTLKADIANELIIPPQHRYIVPLAFGPIEAYHYEMQYLESLQALGLDAHRTAPSPQWRPDSHQMIQCLTRLRQLCFNTNVHAQGNRNPRTRILKTLDDVLQAMWEANSATCQLEERSQAAQIAKRGNLMLYDMEDCLRIEKAIKLFESALIRLKAVLAANKEEIRDVRIKERERRASKESTTASSEDDLFLTDSEDGLSKTQSELDKQMSQRKSTLSTRLRETMLALHTTHFFQGNAYFQLGKYPKEEEQAYAQAEFVRKELLQGDEAIVKKGIELLKSRLTSGKPLEITDLEMTFSNQRPGIQSYALFDELNETSNQLNDIAELLWNWRERLVKALCTDVTIANGDSTGEEYGSSAETQECLDIQVECYQILLGDWRMSLTGERTALASNIGTSMATRDMRIEATLNVTGPRLAKEKAADRKRIEAALATRDSDTAGQKLRAAMMVERFQVIEKNVSSLREVMKRFNDLANSAMREEEQNIAANERDRLKLQYSTLNRALERLTSETVSFQKLYNARVEYFRQLQILSDAVAVIDLKSKDFPGIAAAIQITKVEEAKHEALWLQAETRRRFLLTLKDETAQIPFEERLCVICTDNLKNPVLTPCGHLYCTSCITTWMSSNHGLSTCPACKRPISPRTLMKVQANSASLINRLGDDTNLESEKGLDGSNLQGEVTTDSPPLRMIPNDLLERIQNQQLVGSALGTKLDTVIRHIQMIRHEDPLAKVVLFSAWQPALDVIMRALELNSIGWIRLEGGKKSNAAVDFATKAHITVFLLNSRSQASGLNLTVAQTVILVEPLLHPSLELQSVGRVHRIGQAKETFVYQYYISDTVDERVALLAGRKRRSLFLDVDQSRARAEAENLLEDLSHTIKVHSIAVEETVTDEDDLTACLFERKELLTLQACLLESINEE